MLTYKIQEKWSICEIIDENASFRTFASDEVVYISSQPRYDRFDISAYSITLLFYHITDEKSRLFRKIRLNLLPYRKFHSISEISLSSSVYKRLPA